MAKTKSHADGDTKPAAKVDAEALRKEVAAFASSIGLKPGAFPLGAEDDGDDAFAEFAPENATKKLKDDDGVGAKPDGGKEASKKEKKERKGKQAEADEEAQEDPAPKQQAKQRDWNFGVGPRPGEHGSTWPRMGT